MKDDKDRREPQVAKNPKADPRQDRLKLALRENLKRRKSQARGRSEVAAASTDDHDLSLHDDSGKVPGEN